MLRHLFVLAHFCPPQFQLWSILKIKRDAFITNDELKSLSVLIRNTLRALDKSAIRYRQ